jgi:hypothetical protein
MFLQRNSSLKTDSKLLSPDLMKKYLQYFKVFVVVFLSITVLYYLHFFIHARLHHVLYFNLEGNPSQRSFIEHLIIILIDFFIAFSGFVLVRFYSRKEKRSEDILFLFSVPALFPAFVILYDFIGNFFFHSCGFNPHYTEYEYIIIKATSILLFVSSFIISVYVLLKISKAYSLIFLIELCLFFVYLAAFFAKLIGPVRLPF